MRVWPEKKRRQVRIEIIPMIDVMMFLLVFFVLISINVLPALGLRIKPPTSAKPDQIVDRKRVTISIDREGKTFVDGQPVALADIPERLSAVAEQAAATDPKMPPLEASAQKSLTPKPAPDGKVVAPASNKNIAVVIAGDEAAELQHLVSVLDALKLAGVGTAQIVTRNK